MFSYEERIVSPAQFLHMNDISKFHSAEMDNCLAGKNSLYPPSVHFYNKVKTTGGN